MGAINAAMSSLVKTLNAFPKERAIVARERAKGAYDAAPYFLSKLAAESPIGALFPLLFAGIVYPAAGLHPKLSRCADLPCCCPAGMHDRPCFLAALWMSRVWPPQEGCACIVARKSAAQGFFNKAI